MKLRVISLASKVAIWALTPNRYILSYTLTTGWTSTDSRDCEPKPMAMVIVYDLYELTWRYFRFSPFNLWEVSTSMMFFLDHSMTVWGILACLRLNILWVTFWWVGLKEGVIWSILEVRHGGVSLDFRGGGSSWHEWSSGVRHGGLTRFQGRSLNRFQGCDMREVIWWVAKERIRRLFLISPWTVGVRDLGRFGVLQNWGCGVFDIIWLRDSIGAGSHFSSISRMMVHLAETSHLYHCVLLVTNNLGWGCNWAMFKCHDESPDKWCPVEQSPP